VGREGIAKAALVAAWAATTCCGGGGGTPEETVETFNGAEYAEVLAEQYDGDDLDYGRAEIEDRERISADEVEFAVLYPRRSQPTGPRAIRKITVRKIAGRWYYEPAGS
jgi:hypothetical protein